MQHAQPVDNCFLMVPEIATLRGIQYACFKTCEKKNDKFQINRHEEDIEMWLWLLGLTVFIEEIQVDQAGSQHRIPFHNLLFHRF